MPVGRDVEEDGDIGGRWTVWLGGFVETENLEFVYMECAVV